MEPDCVRPVATGQDRSCPFVWARQGHDTTRGHLPCPQIPGRPRVGDGPPRRQPLRRPGGSPAGRGRLASAWRWPPAHAARARGRRRDRPRSGGRLVREQPGGRRDDLLAVAARDQQLPAVIDLLPPLTGRHGGTEPARTALSALLSRSSVDLRFLGGLVPSGSGSWARIRWARDVPVYSLCTRRASSTEDDRPCTESHGSRSSYGVAVAGRWDASFWSGTAAGVQAADA